MKWYKNLYFGESISPKAHQIMNKIEKNKFTPDVYLVALASNPKNQLDIIPSWELMQSGYPKEQVQVIGLAKGKKEAVALVTSIVEEVYTETKDANIRHYLENKWREPT